MRWTSWNFDTDAEGRSFRASRWKRDSWWEVCVDPIDGRDFKQGFLLRCYREADSDWSRTKKLLREQRFTRLHPALRAWEKLLANFPEDEFLMEEAL